MGGGGSTTEYRNQIIEVHADPALIAALQNLKNSTKALENDITKLENDLKNAELEAKKRGDPKLYEKFREESFDRFVEQLGTMNFTKPIQKESSAERHHVLIGNISSGKSSLINKFFGLKEPVGIGECTPKLKKVATIKNVTIWDSPGMNQEFKIYDPNILSFFHCADKIFILYPDSLKSIPQLIKVLAKIKPNQTFLIRTQTDTWSPAMKKTVKQEIETDVAILQRWGIKLPVYATSAKKEMEFGDNLVVCNLMKLA